MSNAVYPVLPGRTWDTATMPVFNSKIQTSVNLTELRASFSSTPIYHFKLSYDVLRDGVHNGVSYDELRPLLGFFMERRGKWDSFLYEHPDDHSVASEVFAFGDGVTANFPLGRDLGGFFERVANANVVAAVAANGTVLSTPSNYTVAANGTVQFTSAPAVGANLTWTGTYYYRCRFTNDQQEFNQFMLNLWNTKTVEFDGCLGTKL